MLSPEVQRNLAGMLEQTVTNGTARRIFRERAFRVEGAVGKTGTLADKNPFRDYSWFIGFAPKDNPRVAVAAVIVNDPLWRIRATWLGREAMRLALDRLPKPPKTAPEKEDPGSPAPAVAGNAVSAPDTAAAAAPTAPEAQPGELQDEEEEGTVEELKASEGVATPPPP